MGEDMTRLSEKEVLKIIQDIFEEKSIQISMDSSAENTEDWDSLTQINIITELDEALDGKVGELEEMAEADSMKKIFQILKDNSLI
jgi:acyl carrier protein